MTFFWDYRTGGLLHHAAFEAGAAEEVGDGHAFLAGELDFFEGEEGVGEGYVEVGFAVGLDGADGKAGIGAAGEGGAVDFQCALAALGIGEGGPCGGIGAEAADEVVGALGGVFVPADLAGFAEDFGGVAEGLVGEEPVLGNGPGSAGEDFFHGAEDEGGADFHHAVVDGSGVVLGVDGDAFLENDASGVDVVVEEEGGDAGFGVAVDYGPIDGGCATVLGQEGGMEVEGAHRGHGPDDFGQHAEGDDYLEVGPEGLELLEEGFVAQAFGLEYGDALAQGVLLYGAGLELVVMAADGLVGHGYDAHHLVALFDKTCERGYGEIGRAHINDSDVLFHEFGDILIIACKVMEKIKKSRNFAHSFSPVGGTIRYKYILGRRLTMEKILSEEALQLWQELTEKAERPVICVHINPDGDAIGSALAIRHFLARKGKEARIVVPNGFPDFLRWMPGVSDILVYAWREKTVNPIIEAADLFIIADLNTPGRLMGLEAAVMANPAPKIMIDHHTEPADFCQLVVSRPEMCATAEVWCHVLDQLGELDGISLEEATCLYTAMMCDTGAFTYASNRAVVYECISRLLARGIDKDKIYRNVFWTASPARMKLMGYMLYVKMEVLQQQHASLMTLTNEERRLFGIKNGDTEGFVNLPLQIMGMQLSVFLAEDTEHPGVVKVSLRSVDDFPCHEMAARFFNGGGHKNASGGRLQGTMDEAVQTVKKAIKAYEGMFK